MNAYVDASAFVKLLLREEGSDVARTLWERADRVTSSALLYVEARGAVAAAHRARRVSHAASARARERLEELIDRVHVVELEPPLVSLAGDVAETHSLRAGDAVHLASALAVRDAVVVTWDATFRGAAEAAGLAVAPQT